MELPLSWFYYFLKSFPVIFDVKILLKNWPARHPTKKCSYFNSHVNLKVVLQGYPRCPNSHDLSKHHHPYDLDRQPIVRNLPLLHMWPKLDAVSHNSVNFDSKNLSLITLKDHLKSVWRVRKSHTHHCGLNIIFGRVYNHCIYITISRARGVTLKCTLPGLWITYRVILPILGTQTRICTVPKKQTSHPRL